MLPLSSVAVCKFLINAIVNCCCVCQILIRATFNVVVSASFLFVLLFTAIVVCHILICVTVYCCCRLLVPNSCNNLLLLLSVPNSCSR